MVNIFFDSAAIVLGSGASVPGKHLSLTFEDEPLEFIDLTSILEYVPLAFLFLLQAPIRGHTHLRRR